MALERLTIYKIRKIFLLKEEAGLFNRTNARMGKISNSQVSGHYFRTLRLLHALNQTHQEVAYPNFLRFLTRTYLLILDDWLQDELTLTNAQDILEVLDDRYGRASIIITSQMPVTDWFAQIPNPTLADAILDRLVNNIYHL